MLIFHNLAGYKTKAVGLIDPLVSADLRKWKIGLKMQFSYDDLLKTFSPSLIMIIQKLKRCNLRRGDKS
jgi:hypothetical protein